MKVHIAYGRAGLEIEVPSGAMVIVPREPAALENEAKAVVEALTHPRFGLPLADSVKNGDKVVVVFPDITRPMPNRTVLPPLLSHLHELGVSAPDIVLLCATGTHRLATTAELLELLGPEILTKYRVEQHDSQDAQQHAEVGRVDATPIRLDRRYIEAEVRIATGFVEPHFFAGFSGGPKAVCPGLAALETVLEAHSPRRIAASEATYARLIGNPVHDFIRAAVALLPPTMAVDVAIDSDRRLTAVFAGTLPDSHFAACEEVGIASIWSVPERFDVVVTTNSGYPLDRNLYQAVKGLAAAARIVRPGGTIIMACECADGIPAEGRFGDLLRRARSVQDLAGSDGDSILDRWNAQVLGRVLGQSRVMLKADGLTDEQIRAAFMEPVHDVSAAVVEAIALEPEAARLAVLPYGPLSVAQVGPPAQAVPTPS